MNPRTLVAGCAPLGVLLTLLGGCANPTPPHARLGDAPYDVIYSAPFGSVDPAARSTMPLTLSAYRPRWFFLAHRYPARLLPQQIKRDPRLDWWQRVLSSVRRETLLVSFADTVSIPRFPRFDTSGPRTEAKNVTAESLAAIVVADLKLRRQASYAADTAGFDTLDAKVLKTFWLSQAALVEMPLGNVGALAARNNVLYIRPQRGNGPPGDPTYSTVDAICGRNRIGSDRYLDLGLGSGWIGLLDTGALTSHELLNDNQSRWCMVADCVMEDCTTASTTDCIAFAGGVDRSAEGHGTSSAALLAGRHDIHDGRFGGVTRAVLDCFTVYGKDDTLIAPAAADAFELATQRGMPVILAEMQEPGRSNVDLSAFAGGAYDAGAVVIAANGNDEKILVDGHLVPLPAAIPARSRKVLGVGMYDVETGGWDHVQAHGRTEDGRVKPELTAPTNSQTAANGVDNVSLHGFTGTSGAAPYVAGAAMLLQNWMGVSWEITPIDPGQVYALLLLSGGQIGPYVPVPSSPTRSPGGGPLRLHPEGDASWVKTWVSEDLRSVDVPIPVSAGTARLEATIWWPESPSNANTTPSDPHNAIHLELVEPGWFGTVRARSRSSRGVFEHVRLDGSPHLAEGTWKLRVCPDTIRTSPQTVYCAAARFSQIPAAAPACPHSPQQSVVTP